MIFTSPSFLWALGFLAIPIIIHLFQFRRFRKIHFPDISLLKEVQTKSQVKNRIQHLLILLARMAFLAFLIMAFAEPTLPSDTESPEDTPSLVSIYIDNSLSMQNRQEQMHLMSMAKQDAYAISEAYPPETRFQLITNQFSSKERRYYDRASVTTLIDGVTFTPFYKSLDEVLAFHTNSKSDFADGTSFQYLLSDFQTIRQSRPLTSDSSTQFRLINYQGFYEQNISIDSVWINEPIVQKGMELEIFFEATNHGASIQRSIPISLSINKRDVGGVVMDIPENSSRDSSFSVIVEDTWSNIEGQVEVEDQPIEYDNSMLFSIDVKEKIRVTELYNSGSNRAPFKRLFESEECDYQSINADQLNSENTSSTDLLIINEVHAFNSGIAYLVNENLKRGGNVLFILPEELSDERQELMEQEYNFKFKKWDTANLVVNEINTNDQLFQDVFEKQPKNLNLPSVKAHWQISGNGLNPILTLFDGSSLLVSKSIENGNTYFITAPLSDESTNFHNHALFVPTVANMSFYSGQAKKLAYSIGESKVELAFTIPERSQLISADKQNSFYPQRVYDGLLINDQITKPSIYTLKMDTWEFGRFAFNLPRTESQVSTTSDDEVREEFEKAGLKMVLIDPKDNMTSTITEAEFGTSLWVPFLIISLLFLIFESILIKFFRR
jgi:hypothetical protein